MIVQPGALGDGIEGLNQRLASWNERDLGTEGLSRTVVVAPNKVLATAADPVDPQAGATVQLAADLIATMRVSPGCVGLAAPQIGVGSAVFCVDVSQHPKAAAHHGTFALCNAVVVDSSRKEKSREGCMSVPDLTGDVKRASRLVVTGSIPGSGESVTIRAVGFEARCLQHEIDHCDGLLFLDRVVGAHAVHARKTYL